VKIRWHRRISLSSLAHRYDV